MGSLRASVSGISRKCDPRLFYYLKPSPGRNLEKNIMKKFLRLSTTFVLALLATFPTLAYSFSAKNADGVEIYYNIKSAEDKTCEVTYKDENYNSYTGSVKIPISVTYSRNSYSVTSIGANTFYNCQELTAVTIPNSVTSIGYYAFYCCFGLTSVNIPNSVTYIDKAAFFNCTGLTSVTIPNSVTSLGANPFNKCSGLKAFYGKFASKDNRCLIVDNTLVSFAPSGLSKYTIPNSVTSIGEAAFAECYSLTSVTIPNSVTSIGKYAFRNCKGLTEVTIGNSVTSIGEYAFTFCTGLKSVTIPNSVTSIGEYAFWSCTGLTSMTIPNSVTSIGKAAFMECYGLTSITIPNSVTSLGDYVFYGCTGLTSLTSANPNPSKITLGKSVFELVPTSSCTLYVPKGSKTAYAAADQWKDFGNIEETAYDFYAVNEDGVVIYYNILSSEDKTCEVTFKDENYNSYSGSVKIPASVTYSGTTYSVASIGISAFRGCSGLTAVNIPNSVTSIEDYAFYLCEGLTSVTIPNSVTSIGTRAFSDCTGLTSFYGKFASEDNRCLIIDSKLVAFAPYGLTEYTIPNSVTSIGNYAFINCTGLASVTIANSVTSIGASAFVNCTGLASVTIANSVTTIGARAFFG